MAGDAVFIADPAAWNRAFRSWPGMTGRHMYTKTLQVNARAMIEAPGPSKVPRNRTRINYSFGYLENMIRPLRGRHRDELEGRVVALPKHAIYVHQGTRPHVIAPKKPGGSLKFFWAKKGRVVTLPKVNHPGTAANPFLMRALKAVFRG